MDIQPQMVLHALKYVQSQRRNIKHLQNMRKKIRKAVYPQQTTKKKENDGKNELYRANRITQSNDMDETIRTTNTSGRPARLP